MLTQIPNVFYDEAVDIAKIDNMWKEPSNNAMLRIVLHGKSFTLYFKSEEDRNAAYDFILRRSQGEG